MLQYAQVLEEPVADTGRSAELLRRLNPFTLSTNRSPFTDPNDVTVTDSSLQSCVVYSGRSSLLTVITYELDKAYNVSAIFVTGRRAP